MIVTTDLVKEALPKECINKIQESGATLLGVISNSTKKQNNQILNKYSYGTYSYTYNSYLEEKIKEEKSNSNQESRFDKIKVSLLSSLKKEMVSFYSWLDILIMAEFKINWILKNELAIGPAPLMNHTLKY